MHTKLVFVDHLYRSMLPYAASRFYSGVGRRTLLNTSCSDVRKHPAFGSFSYKGGSKDSVGQVGFVVQVENTKHLICGYGNTLGLFRNIREHIEI